MDWDSTDRLDVLENVLYGIRHIKSLETDHLNKEH